MTATASSITTTRIDDAAALFIVSLISSALCITQTEVKKSVIHKRRAMLNGKVSRRYGKPPPSAATMTSSERSEQQRAAYPPAQGGCRRRSTLGAGFFAYKNKKATL